MLSTKTYNNGKVFDIGGESLHLQKFDQSNSTPRLPRAYVPMDTQQKNPLF